MAKKTKRELNWYKPRKGYTKTIRGKRHYFNLGGCKGPNDQEGYRQALKEYLALVDQLDREEAQQIEEFAAQGRLPNGSKLEHVTAYTDYSSLRRKLGMGAGDEGGESTAEYRTITGLVGAYLEARKMLADSRQISQSSYASDKYRLGDFLGFCNAEGATQIDDVLFGGMLAEYRKLQLGGMSLAEGEKGYISPTSAKHRLRTVKACIMWGHENTNTIDKLPKGLRTYAQIKIDDDKRPKFFTLKEVRKLFKAATPKMKTCLALSLNCVFTQADISGLTHDMVDWKKGIIEKRRNKTGRVLGRWKLWPITLQLLKENANPDTGGPLLTNRGQKLLRESIKADGTPSKGDTIRNWYRTLKKKAGITNGRTFKHFRKTSSNMIRQQYPEHPYLYDQFLAHEPVGTGKFYSDPTFKLQDQATDWLGEQYALDTVQS